VVSSAAAWRLKRLAQKRGAAFAGCDAAATTSRAAKMASRMRGIVIRYSGRFDGAFVLGSRGED